MDPQGRHVTHPCLHIKSAHEAHVLFEAVRLGHLPMIRRRLSGGERAQLRSGDVFVWEEAAHKGGLERWTDGRKWSASRMREPFLFYEEKVARKGPYDYNSTSPLPSPGIPGVPPPISPYHTHPSSSPSSPGGGGYYPYPSQQTPSSEPSMMGGINVNGSMAMGVGLTKQTYSAWVTFPNPDGSMPTGDAALVGRKKWHMTAYFSPASFASLPGVSEDSLLRTIRVPTNMYETGKGLMRKAPSKNTSSGSVGGSGASPPPPAQMLYGGAGPGPNAGQNPTGTYRNGWHYPPQQQQQQYHDSYGYSSSRSHSYGGAPEGRYERDDDSMSVDGGANMGHGGGDVYWSERKRATSLSASSASVDSYAYPPANAGQQRPPMYGHQQHASYSTSSSSQQQGSYPSSYPYPASVPAHPQSQYQDSYFAPSHRGYDSHSTGAGHHHHRASPTSGSDGRTDYDEGTTGPDAYDRESTSSMSMASPPPPPHPSMHYRSAGGAASAMNPRGPSYNAPLAASRPSGQSPASAAAPNQGGRTAMSMSLTLPPPPSLFAAPGSRSNPGTPDGGAAPAHSSTSSSYPHHYSSHHPQQQSSSQYHAHSHSHSSSHNSHHQHAPSVSTIASSAILTPPISANSQNGFFPPIASPSSRTSLDRERERGADRESMRDRERGDKYSPYARPSTNGSNTGSSGGAYYTPSSMRTATSSSSASSAPTQSSHAASNMGAMRSPSGEGMQEYFPLVPARPTSSSSQQGSGTASAAASGNKDAYPSPPPESGASGPGRSKEDQKVIAGFRVTL